LSNKRAYESEDVVAYYQSYGDELQKPEETILRLLQPVLTSGRVLDIGVGAGRTTKSLSAVAREYVGIDYSATMVAASQEKFRGAQHVHFLVCDARDMRIFADHYFDFVMFSFNGLDSVMHDDRLRVLREVRRVLRSGGWFSFSSLNLSYASRLFSYFPILDYLRKRLSHQAYSRWYLSSDRTVGSLWRYVLSDLLAPVTNAKRRALNPRWFEVLNQEYAILNDGAHDWRLKNYYVDPRYQVEQLHATGFANVRFFSRNGAEIASVEQPERSHDSWLYYLCEAKT
jgi:ubiquinone/menaquinone biosynthesis C-methylase UbiE